MTMHHVKVPVSGDLVSGQAQELADLVRKGDSVTMRLGQYNVVITNTGDANFPVRAMRSDGVWSAFHLRTCDTCFGDEARWLANVNADEV